MSERASAFIEQLRAKFPTEPTMRYAGIGSRETPRDICALMTRIADKLDDGGYKLRTGGALGADSAFMAGALEENVELFLPWRRYNGLPENVGYAMTQCVDDTEACKLAALAHPRWVDCKRGAEMLHARNGYIVLGKPLCTPVDYVVCWTRDGATTTTSMDTGGTGQAIRIANLFNIPVWNLKVTDHRAYWLHACSEED
jgi:hypothetical protein